MNPILCPACHCAMIINMAAGSIKQWYTCLNTRCALELPEHPKFDQNHYCPDCFSTLTPTNNEQEVENEYECLECEKFMLEDDTNSYSHSATIPF